MGVIIRRAVKCVNPICRVIYGCQIESTKYYCVDCPYSDTCTIICVEDVSGGICADCLASLRKRGDS